ncbi:hypothetical protein Bca4012_083072 [Brassica carinata]|uniref:Uncharacterized protein n=1 Tax=Brassica carinata TaxID=52824 RepID=A0A8X8ALK8_BRACI|nr:hypothetical protein Bca52824_027722 [Brassica carinata]
MVLTPQSSKARPSSSRRSPWCAIGLIISALRGLAMGRYSYSQPSSSEAYPERSDSGESETEDLIRRDQAEIELQYGDGAQYPPQPEMEFGFPQTCYCGGEPRIAPSRAGTAKKKSSVTDRFEVVVGVMLVVVVVIGVVMALK